MSQLQRIINQLASLDDVGAFSDGQVLAYDQGSGTFLGVTQVSQGDIDEAIAALVGSSPATLDTLNELAAALGDDPNFAATMATSLAGKVNDTGDTMTGALNIGNGVLVASAPTLNLSQEWNNAAVVFTALDVNVTDDASDSLSRLLDLRKGGTTQFFVDKNGNVRIQTNNRSFYIKDIAGNDVAVLSLSSSNNAIVKSADASGSILLQVPNATGAVSFLTNNTTRWNVRSDGHFAAQADNTYDIGLSASVRPRTGYFATSLVAPTINATTGFQVAGVALAAANLSNGVQGSGAVVLASSPTITTPTIGSFANSNHTHQNSAGGGTLDAAAIAAGTLAAARGGVAGVETADQGYFVGGFGNLPLPASSAAVIVSSNNQMRVQQFVLPYRVVVQHITLEVTTAGGSGSTVNVGIYDAAGTTLLIDSGTFDGNSTGATQTKTLGQSVTLPPGVYWFAYSASVSTIQCRVLSGNTNFDAIVFNGQTAKKKGTSSNSVSVGSLPPSIGTITAGNGNNIPLASFER